MYQPLITFAEILLSKSKGNLSLRGFVVIAVLIALFEILLGLPAFFFGTQYFEINLIPKVKIL